MSSIPPVGSKLYFKSKRYPKHKVEIEKISHVYEEKVVKIGKPLPKSLPQLIIRKIDLSKVKR